MAERKGRPGERKETRKARILSPEYQRLRQRLESAIAKSGESKRALSFKLTNGKDGAFLYHVLTARRSIELLELIEIARVLGLSPHDLLAAALGEEGGGD